jgi:hypothetical protein
MSGRRLPTGNNAGGGATGWLAAGQGGAAGGEERRGVSLDLNAQAGSGGLCQKHKCRFLRRP